LHWLWV